MEPIGRSTYGFCQGRAGPDTLCNAQACQSSPDDVTVERVAISVHPTGRRVVGKLVDNLLRGPRRGWVIGDVDMHDLPAVLRQQDEDEQDPAGDRRNSEEIHRRR
jgi:hypothetical protein